MEEDFKAEKGAVWKEYIVDFYKPVVSLLLAILFIFFVVKPLLKKRPSPQPGKAVPLIARSDQIPVPEAAQVAGTKKPLEIRDQTLQLVREDPSKTVGIVKTWLHERE
jgi:flagellar biosynthesis/type III secretory pathway M-ring protein FliF/YscJ